MTYTYNQLINALDEILGRDTVAGLMGARISVPRICTMAAETAFVDQMENDSTEILRTALKDLQSKAKFNCVF